MSIYPVRLNEFYPKGDENHEIAKIIIKQATCQYCGKTPRYRWAIGFHSLPWGYHTDPVWCGAKCMYWGKKAAAK